MHLEKQKFMMQEKTQNQFFFILLFNKNGIKLSSLSKNNQTEIIYITPTFYQNGEFVKLKKDFFMNQIMMKRHYFKTLVKDKLKNIKRQLTGPTYDMKKVL